MKISAPLGMIALSLGMAATVEAARPVQPALAKSDETAILTVVGLFCQSWTRHDMDAMHALDTPDVEWVNVVGNDWRGLADVRKGHTNYHRFLAAKGTCSVDSVAVRSIEPNVAVAVSVFHFEGYGPDAKPEDTHTRSSMVMVKRAGAWKVIHQQNTIINPATQGGADPLNFDERTGLPKPPPK